jgi:hypothetical protein
LSLEDSETYGWQQNYALRPWRLDEKYSTCHNLLNSLAYFPFCGIFIVKDTPNSKNKQQGGWLEACKETDEGCNTFEVGKRMGLVDAI